MCVNVVLVHLQRKTSFVPTGTFKRISLFREHTFDATYFIGHDKESFFIGETNDFADVLFGQHLTSRITGVDNDDHRRVGGLASLVDRSLQIRDVQRPVIIFIQEVPNLKTVHPSVLKNYSNTEFFYNA